MHQMFVVTMNSRKMTSVAHALATAAFCSMVFGAHAATAVIPLGRGMYAKAGASCDPQGSYDAYNAQLSFWGGELNNSVTERKFLTVLPGAAGYDIRLHATQSDGVGGGGAPEDVSWRLTVPDRRHFVLRGRDHGQDWSGQYRYCKPLPEKEARTAPTTAGADGFESFALRTLRDLYSTETDVDPRSPLARRTYTASLLAADAMASAVAEARNEPWGTILTKRHGQDLEPVVSKAFAVVGPEKAAVTLRLKPLNLATARLERFPTRLETAVYTFAREGGSWKVDDVTFVDARGLEVADVKFLASMEIASGKPLSTLLLEPGGYAGDPAEYAPAQEAGRCGAVVVGANGRDLHMVDPRSNKADACVTKQLAWNGDMGGIVVTSACASGSQRSLIVTPLTPRSLLLDHHVYRFCEPASAPTIPHPAVVPLAAPISERVDLTFEPGTEAYVHNGSYVNVSPTRGLVTYREPSASMRSLVRKNEVVFAGIIGVRRSSGIAYLFKRGCPPLGFYVEGTGQRSGEDMVLKGDAPVRLSKGCTPTPGASRATVLRFEPAGGYNEPEYDGHS